MDLSKSLDVFDPTKVRERIHVIGCGSVGSTVVELLARYGLTKFTLYDFDIVEPKNIANQMFTAEHVGKMKVEALRDIVCSINPDAKADIRMEPKGWVDQNISGYVILAPDNIEVRKEFVKQNRMNPNIKGVFDFRTGLFDAQHYAADWGDPRQIEALWKSMDFTHEEAKAETPVSACGIVLGVAPTVRVICDFGVINFINFATKGEIKKTILSSPFALNMGDGMVLAM